MKVKNLFQKRHNLVGLLVGKMVRVESEREQNEAEFKAIYTPRASQVFALAEGEALRLSRDFIATEHVLLGLVQFGQGIAVNVLRSMDLDLEQVRLKIEEQVTGAGEMKKHHPMQLTPCVKKVLVRAQDEARSLFHGYVGTEHILLGLLSDDGGVAARILQDFGVAAAEARRQILKELDPNEN